MEEKKNNKVLMIGLIIFLIICLILVFYFMFKMVYKEPSNNSTNEQSNTETSDKNKIEIKNLDEILKLIPIKLNNGIFSSYKVEELTDLEINDALCRYIYNNNFKKSLENGYMLEKSKSSDVLIKFLGLNNYQINIKAGNSDIRFKLEETVENEIKFYKLNFSNIPTDNFETYEYKNMNSISYDKENQVYIVKTEIVEIPGGGPVLRIGTADVYLKYLSNDYVLDKVEFQRYSENIIESN